MAFFDVFKGDDEDLYARVSRVWSAMVKRRTDFQNELEEPASNLTQARLSDIHSEEKRLAKEYGEEGETERALKKYNELEQSHNQTDVV